ncbi:MAG: anaerobic ribonucleoside-triphosphate reductase activating protein [Lachnospiraceae bacterium]|nr:anaerobic ribonucleoside-triphosphate reductase activating protein [Lachnospiraceae bacterium]
MYYSVIKYHDIANGTGVRTVLFVSGCTHHCKGCFQPQTWDFDYGQPFTDEVAREIIDSLDDPFTEGLTLLGGEPMEPVNQRALLPMIREIKKLHPDKNIWCYSGYTYETDLVDPDGKAHCEVTDELLDSFDVLVDGEFILELRDISLQFRGSSNQRILNLREMRH